VALSLLWGKLYYIPQKVRLEGFKMKDKVQKEVRYHEGIRYVYIVLPVEYRVRRQQLIKLSEEPRHEWTDRLLRNR
jgi:hypothetical protein